MDNKININTIDQKWSKLLNAGTDPINNGIGTSDNQDLAIKTNSTEKMRVTTGGNVGIGTINPNRLLDVAGTVAITNEILIRRGNTQEGGQITLEQGNSGTGITIDQYQPTSTKSVFRVFHNLSPIANFTLQDNGGFIVGGDANSYRPNTKFTVVGLPNYATNALAIAGGLQVGDVYRNGGVVMIVI